MIKAINIVADYMRQRALISSQLKSQKDYQIQFYNFWGQKNEDMYWQQFITSQGLLDTSPNKKVAFFSVFGDRKIINMVDADIKIFYSGENLKQGHLSSYSDNCLSNSDINLAMGFESIDNPKYIRFPLWMGYMFAPNFTEENIIRRCQDLRYPVKGGRQPRRFCCMVASNPGDGLRKQMFDRLSELGHVDSAGRYLHNDDSLYDSFDNIKERYIAQYNFNICPENSDADGYVTEKIFEAISSGCVPIYWGSSLNPEPGILNKDAIIIWDRNDNGSAAIKKISDLISSPDRLNEFIMQPRLTDDAEAKIINNFEIVRESLKHLISN